MCYVTAIFLSAENESGLDPKEMDEILNFKLWFRNEEWMDFSGLVCQKGQFFWKKEGMKLNIRVRMWNLNPLFKIKKMKLTKMEKF